MPADQTAEQPPNDSDTGAVQLPREKAINLNVKDVVKAGLMNRFIMDPAMAAAGIIVPGGWIAMTLLDLFLIHPLTGRSHHSLNYIKASLPRECATFMRAVLIRDDHDALRSAIDTQQVAAGPEQGNLNILNAKGYALLQLENQELKDPQTGPMHCILAEMLRFQTESKMTLNDASLEDSRNPLSVNGKVSRAQQVAADAIEALTKTQEGKSFLWQADRIAGAKVLPEELMQALNNYAVTTAAKRHSQVAIFDQPDGTDMIMPQTQGIGSPYKTDVYTIHTLPDGQRIGYRVRNGEYEIKSLTALYDQLRQETAGREPVIFRPNRFYTALLNPNDNGWRTALKAAGIVGGEVIPTAITPKNIVPASSNISLATLFGVPADKVVPANIFGIVSSKNVASEPAVEIPKVNVVVKPITVTVFATPGCPFIENIVGPILRLLNQKLSEQQSPNKIQVTVIGTDADASKLRKTIAGNVMVNAGSASLLKPYNIRYSCDYVIASPNQAPQVRKGWSQGYVLELADKMGLYADVKDKDERIKLFKNDIRKNKDAYDAYIALPKIGEHSIEGCEFMLHRTTQIVPPAASINGNPIVFLNAQSLIRYQLAGRTNNFAVATNLKTENLANSLLADNIANVVFKS